MVAIQLVTTMSQDAKPNVPGSNLASNTLTLKGGSSITLYNSVGYFRFSAENIIIMIIWPTATKKKKMIYFIKKIDNIIWLTLCRPDWVVMHPQL